MVLLDTHVALTARVVRINFIDGEGSRHRVETIQAVAGSRPKRSTAVFKDANHHIVTQTARMIWVVQVDLEVSGCSIESLESATVGSYPKISGAVPSDRGDIVLTAVTVKSVPAGVPINAVDSPLGPNPENSPIILINCVDVCPVEAIVIRLLVLETFKCQRLSGEPVDTRTQDSYPHHPFTILE